MRPSKRPNGTYPAPLVSGEYMDMLREYKRDSKQRRIKEEGGASSSNQSSRQATASPEPSAAGGGAGAAVFNASEIINVESDSDMNSDDFEDVELEDVALEGSDAETYDANRGDDNVVVSFNDAAAALLTRKRKSSNLSKPKRLLLHKIELIAWLYHVRTRNKWLLDPRLIHSSQLTSMLPVSVTAQLFPPEHLTPFLKSKQFVEGLRLAMQVWQHQFEVVRPGLASSAATNLYMESNDPTIAAGDSGVCEEYIEQILSLRGSLDLEGQGFVALLRSIGLDTRLVCSLQPPDNLGVDTGTSTARSKTPTTASSCPIFWAEVWDPYVDRWVAVDTVTSTVRLPTRNKVKLKIEPPQSDKFNVLRYCIALDSHNHVRDVTRRYSSNFNARTRKKRLPHFESDEWLDRLFGQFSIHKFTKRDRDELVELARYPRLEGIPTRVQDFVGHPEYALADQLRSNEVLKPGAQPTGILSLKSAAGSKNRSPKPTYIYQRKDVLTARSSQSWYKRGRSIKLGAQPRGHRDRRNRLTGETDSIALYTEEQTELYVPAPVNADGSVPKSQYRTIDVFTDSMIPEGGVYIKSKYGTQAAKLLKIDFANVVTRVEFGKRGPQSHMFGVIVASQFAPAVNAVIRGFLDVERENAEREEELRILLLWRKFIMGIQIWERVERMNPSNVSHDTKLDDKSHESEDDNANDTDTKILPEMALHPKHRQTIPKPLSRRNATPSASIQRKQDEVKISAPKGSRIIYLRPSMAFGPRSSTLNRSPAQSDSAPMNRVKEDPDDQTNRQTGEPDEPVKSVDIHDLDGSDSYHSFSDLDVDEISESEL